MPFACCPPRSGARSTPSTRSAGWSTTAWTSQEEKERRAFDAGSRRFGAPTREPRRPSSGASWPRPCSSFRSRARASRTSWPAAGWTSPSGATRPSTTCEPTACAWPLPWASPPSRSSATKIPAPGTMRSSWAWPCRSRTSCATWPWMPRATGSTCRSKTSLASVSPRRRCFEATRAPAGPRPSGIDALLAFEADRARDHFERARRALPAVDRRAMLSAEIMGAVYRALLEEISRRGHPLTLPVVRLSRPRKAAIALRTVPRVYWGL